MQLVKDAPSDTSICWETVKFTQIYNVYDVTWAPLNVAWLCSARPAQLYIASLLDQFTTYHSEEGEWFHRIKWRRFLQWTSIVCVTAIHSSFL